MGNMTVCPGPQEDSPKSPRKLSPNCVLSFHEKTIIVSLHDNLLCVQYLKMLAIVYVTIFGKVDYVKILKRIDRIVHIANYGQEGVKSGNLENFFDIILHREEHNLAILQFDGFGGF